MWNECKIKVLGEVMHGISAEGRDWQRQEMILEFADYDFEGKPLMKQSGEPYKNLVKLDLFGQWVERVSELGLVVEQEVYAEIRIQTESAKTRDGRSYVRNNVYLADIRKK